MDCLCIHVHCQDLDDADDFTELSNYSRFFVIVDHIILLPFVK